MRKEEKKEKKEKDRTKKTFKKVNKRKADIRATEQKENQMPETKVTATIETSQLN